LPDRGHGTAINSNPVLAAFYSILAARSAAKDGLRLYFLCMDGRRIAFQYCLETNNELYLLKSGYDTDFAPYSPSQLLLWKVLESAYTRGVREYDLLGGADDWKMVWAKKTRELVWFIVYSKTLRGRLLWLLKLKIVPKVRAARQRLRRIRSDGNLGRS
jgi:CelD/BcsL family acetyltransferase involved in cellulose biosynthesis